MLMSELHLPKADAQGTLKITQIWTISLFAKKAGTIQDFLPVSFGTSDEHVLRRCRIGNGCATVMHSCHVQCSICVAAVLNTSPMAAMSDVG